MGLSPVLSRYHQQHLFFMSKSPPNLGDYNFLNPCYMIVCSGYQSLVGKENVCVEQEYWASNLNDNHDDEALTNINLDIPQRSEGQNVFNRLARKHYQRFSSGTVRMALRASCSDLLLLLTAQVKDGKRIGFLKVGNEPDWNLRNVLNSLYVCRLYAARYLAHNNMEHIWSLMR